MTNWENWGAFCHCYTFWLVVIFASAFGRMCLREINCLPPLSVFHFFLIEWSHVVLCHSCATVTALRNNKNSFMRTHNITSLTLKVRIRLESPALHRHPSMPLPIRFKPNSRGMLAAEILLTSPLYLEI